LSLEPEPPSQPVAAPAKPKVKLVEVVPAARPARLKRRHRMAVLTLLLCVVLPALALAIYLYNFAADQYASTVGFTVRTEETGSAMEILGGLTSFSSASSSDTDVLYKFIQSQELVRDMDATLDLRQIYRKPENDPVFALAPGASIEDLVAYWERMVRIYYDPGTGLMEIEARAFDPADAKAISSEIYARSTKMINTLSAVARNDTTRYASEELDTAVERLKVARQALTLFRNETQIVDPSADIQGQMGLLSSLNAQLATSLIDLDLLAETTRETDPRVEQTRRKIAVIENRISEEREKLGVGTNHNGRAYADLVGQFEALQVDLEFAEKAYVSALSAYDSAVAEARRQSRYLAAYIEPTLAETPLYPQRAIILMISAFALFGIWAISLLIYYSLRDRR
jgi:capsular polysaccharide transport system permease protein